MISQLLFCSLSLPKKKTPSGGKQRMSPVEEGEDEEQGGITIKASAKSNGGLPTITFGEWHHTIIKKAK